MKLEFHPAAANEFSKSVFWYEARARGLGRKFRDEISRTLVALLRNPRVGKPLFGDVYRTPLRTFPYWLIYQVRERGLRVIAVAHARRRPGYWSRRR